MTEHEIFTTIKAIDSTFLELREDVSTGHSLYMKVVVAINELSRSIETAEKLGVDKDTIKSWIGNARSTLSLSPYIKRIQTWPRGYQGDFETVEMMNSGVTSCNLPNLSSCLEYYAQNLPITQQHRNKLVHQERLALGAISKGHNILSVGCGGAIDIANALTNYPGYSGDITFMDMDEDAIKLVEKRTKSYDFNYSTKNIIRGVGKEKNDHYNLILCGGIFDYFDEKVGGLLIKQLEKKLADNGILFITNIAEGNPFRIQMEYLCDWELIERTEQSLAKLIQSSTSNNYRIIQEREATGLAILTTAILSDLQ